MGSVLLILSVSQLSGLALIAVVGGLGRGGDSPNVCTDSIRFMNRLRKTIYPIMSNYAKTCKCFVL